MKKVMSGFVVSGLLVLCASCMVGTEESEDIAFVQSEAKPSSSSECGNGYCDPYIKEDCETCPADCGKCSAACGNGKCDIDPCETPVNCPEDCPYNVCGNHFCEYGEWHNKVWSWSGVPTDPSRIYCLSDCNNGVSDFTCTEVAEATNVAR